MRQIVRLIFVLYILFGFYVIAQDTKKKTDAKPHLTDAQKLEIRVAQVKVYQSKEVLEQTPQFKAFAQAQAEMNDVALKVQREVRADATKWTLGQDLEYVAVPQAPEKK